MGATLLGVKEEAAERYARTHGLPWDDEVSDRLEVCEKWHLKREREKERLRSRASAGDGDDSVN